MEKLNLKPGEKCSNLAFISPEVLKRETECGGVNLQSENEIFFVPKGSKLIREKETQTKLSCEEIEELTKKLEELETKLSEAEKLKRDNNLEVQDQITELTTERDNIQRELTNQQTEITQLNNILQTTQQERDRIQQNSFTPEGYEELKTKLFEMILREIKDWELIFSGTDDVEYFRHKLSKKRINVNAVFGFKQSYRIMGELGYRKNIWENYEETIKGWEERDRHNSNNQSSQPETQPTKNPTQEQTPQNNSPSINNPPTSNQKPENQNNPSPNQDQLTEPTNKDNSPTPSDQSNNPLPSNTDIQSHCNSDKDKSIIENNSTLTTPAQKDQAQELLKLIITTEPLVKDQKFNQQILSQLIKEKDNNTLAYQLLNQEGRIEQAISQLQSIQKKLKNNDKTVDNHQPSALSLSTKLLIGEKSEISPPISGKKKSLLLTGKNEYEKLDRELKEYQELSQEVSKEEQSFLLVEIKNLEEKKAELINKIKEQIIEEEGN
ncbi:9285_t:CDS:2, partial [Ambispora leptoticha]